MSASILAAASVTLVGLALAGLSSDKRRRVSGETPAPAWWRPVALGALGVGAGLCALDSGATLLVWIAATSGAGWIVAYILASPNLLLSNRAIAKLRGKS